MVKSPICQATLLQRWKDGEYPTLGNFDIFPELVNPVRHSQVPDQAWEGIQTKAEFFELILEAEAEFLQIVSRKAKTLEDSARGIQKRPFTELLSNEKDSKWYSKCSNIDQNFLFEKLSPIIVTQLTEREKQKNPQSKFSLNNRGDGQHRCLVYALKLLNGGNYQSVKAIYFEPHLNLQRQSKDQPYRLLPPKWKFSDSGIPIPNDKK